MSNFTFVRYVSTCLAITGVKGGLIYIHGENLAPSRQRQLPAGAGGVLFDGSMISWPLGPCLRDLFADISISIDQEPIYHRR